MEAPENESFRDSIGTINEDGKRAWVFPKKPSGKFYEKRKAVSYVLLAILIASPFIKLNGNQFLMFNVLERRFNVFGFPFWPQDFHLFVISMIIGVIFITLFTVGFGRIFCGWICPQTIFMEMVFRRIEYWIDGDRNKQRRLKKQKWDAEKIKKRLFKWFIFLVISFLNALPCVAIISLRSSFDVLTSKLFAVSIEYWYLYQNAKSKNSNPSIIIDNVIFFLFVMAYWDVHYYVHDIKFIY